MYWIDPNGGCSADGFQVHCDYEDGSCATCIDAEKWVQIFDIFVDRISSHLFFSD